MNVENEFLSTERVARARLRCLLLAFAQNGSPALKIAQKKESNCCAMDGVLYIIDGGGGSA